MDRLTESAHARGEAPAVVNLGALQDELLAAARSSHAGRAGRTLVPGAGAALKQTVLALLAGRSLADHDSPAAAALQVLCGAVRLTGGGEELELRPGDHAAIPPVRHGLAAAEDAVVLISVGKGSKLQVG